MIAESPIDALSYKQIHKVDQGTMYLSTCGSITNDMKGELASVLAGAKEKGQEIVLAFDNDKTGKEYATLLKSYFEQADKNEVAKTVSWSNVDVAAALNKKEKVSQSTFESELPIEVEAKSQSEIKVASPVSGKDWNEVLVQQLDREDFAHMRKVQNALAAGGHEEEEELSRKPKMNVLGIDM